MIASYELVSFVYSTVSEGVWGYLYPHFYVEVLTDNSGTYVLTRNTIYTHNLHDTYTIYKHNFTRTDAHDLRDTF